MKRLILPMLLISVLALTACGKAPIVDTPAAFSGILYDTGSVFVVGQSQTDDHQVYGLVVADNMKTIVSSVGGDLIDLNCQPGAHVSATSVIAQIKPSATDVNVQNSLIQKAFLQQQIANMQSIISLTEDNFDVQKDILIKQKENNAYLMDKLQDQKDLSASDMKLQISSLQDQQDALENTQSRDSDKMEQSISTLRGQLSLAISDALKKVDDIWAIHQTTKTSFDASLSAKDPTLRTKLGQQFVNLYDRYQSFDDLTDSEVSSYLSNLSTMLKTAALASAASSASSNLPQSASAGVSVDGLYGTYLALSTSFLASKTSYDSLLASADSLDNNYDTQLDTLDTSLTSLSKNKKTLSTISSDTQIANMELAQASVQSQLESLATTRTLQLASLRSQLLTLQQNDAAMSNSLAGERLLAGVSGIVKAKLVGELNKVGPSTPLCQILPDGAANLKIQIYSYDRIALGQQITFWRGTTLLGNGHIVYELPYKDSATQNYIYEMVGVSLPVLDGEKVTVKFSTTSTKWSLWIPLSYVMPRLEGNFVKKIAGAGLQETQVSLWDINGNVVEVLSGLVAGESLVY